MYYTPREVVELQVRLISELLETRFGKKRGFADDGVVFLDPAVGTGTYPVAAVKNGLDRVRARYGEGAVPARAAQMARNMHAFELLVGPYAVAHLRLTQALESEGANLGNRLNIYLADALESPNAAPPGGLTLTYKALTEEHEAARKVKTDGEILVCLGNPPYDRQQIEEGDTATQRKGGWVRFGDQIAGGAKQEKQGERPIFSDFLEPARAAGAGLHLKNLYNDYVYFWRWALWRLFEQQSCGGIVSFITASSYLAGPGFVGMREVMRRTFDELWILDLGGDNLGTRKSPNVFAIQTPVAIALGVRGNTTAPETPATVHYGKVTAESRDAKLAVLEAMSDFANIEWADCPSDWHAPFLPAGKGNFFNWPQLTALFPYQRSGSKFGRTWPIGETQEVLNRRWASMVAATGTQRRDKFMQNKYRKIHVAYRDHRTGQRLPSIETLPTNAEPPKTVRYGFRSYDRHWAFEDIRLNDRMGEVLWVLNGDNQVYFISLASEALGLGQGIIASASVPDLHHFRGSFGGKDVIPLYRDALGTHPNVTAGLLDAVGAVHGLAPSAEDLAAYVYAVMGGQSYTQRFWNELETPGPRLPVTKERDLFAEAATLGRRLIWLHTYAERFQGEGRSDEIPAGRARCIAAVPDDPRHYPEDFDYESAKQQIRVGEGRFGPVASEVWNFEVSGLKVVQSWLGYRMKKRAGKKSSPLDEIRPERWTATMTDEFLELLWVLEATLAMEPDLADVLDRIVAGPCFTTDELPKPSDGERKPPAVSGDAGELLGLMGGE